MRQINSRSLQSPIEAADDSGNVSLSVQVADAMAQNYQVDETALKADAAIKTLRTPDSSVAAENCRAGIAILKKLAAEEDFATAAKLVATLLKGVPGRILATGGATIYPRCGCISDRSRSCASHAGKQKDSPPDPAASFSAGKYDCFFRNDWNTGLPKLAAGSDKAIAALASARSDQSH